MTRRKAYPLHQSPLYKLVSRKRLAQLVFNAELPWLERLASNGDKNYRVFEISQGDKKRQVETPKPILERIHRRLFALLERVEKPSYLHSGVKGRSYITNAKVHVGTTPLVKLDIKKFYSSVTSDRVYRFFNGPLQCSPDVAGLLTKLTTYGGHAPTGSCVSQLLAFFAAKPMFDALHDLATTSGNRASIYVDDMAFSGAAATPSFLWQVKQLVHSHGFDYHKDRAYTGNARKFVTGVMIAGDRIAVLPSRERDLWLQSQALGSGDAEQRRSAITSLIGSVTAAGQIESRLLRRVHRLRSLRAELDRHSEQDTAAVPAPRL